MGPWALLESGWPPRFRDFHGCQIEATGIFVERKRRPAPSQFPSHDRLLRSLMSHPSLLDFGKDRTRSLAEEAFTNAKFAPCQPIRELVRPMTLHYSALAPSAADDLIQVCLLGLIRGAELFSTSLGRRQAFARQHIRGAILHYLRDFRRRRSGYPGASRNFEGRLRQLKRPGPCGRHANPTPRRSAPPLGLGLTQLATVSSFAALARPVSLEIFHGLSWPLRPARKALAQGLRKEGAMRFSRGSIRPASGWSGGWFPGEGWQSPQAAKAIGMSVRLNLHAAAPRALRRAQEPLKESSQILDSE